MKSTVLITSSLETDASNGMKRFALSRCYPYCVSAAGGIPLVAALSREHCCEYAEMADALLLSGGNDVAPERYGERENPVCRLNVDWERDEFEFSLLKEFVKRKKTVLGICRGMQVINVFFGGTLWQDLQAQLGISHSGGIKHTVTIKKNSIMESIYGDKVNANSFHHQAVKIPGDGLIVSSECNGIVESIEHQRLPVIGVQFHPEKMNEGLGLFERFLKSAANAGG